MNSRKTIPFLFLSLLLPAFAFAGKKSPNSFKAILKRHDAEFQRCYDSELTRSKKPTQGRINLRVTLDANGRVVETGPTQNTTKSRFLADCLVRAVEKIPFGKQKKPRTVYIHVFKFALPPSKTVKSAKK